jgi:hypothetical protein
LVQIERTRWSFVALCMFVLSQAYTIPIIPVGPWPLWPRLSDFAAILLLAATFLQRSYLWTPSLANRQILRGSLVFFWLALLSYLGYLFAINGEATAGARSGAFQIYTLALFFSVFVAISHVPLDERRLHILRRLTDVVLVVVIVGVILTFFEVVSLAALTPQLPRGVEEAGPWYRYGLSLAETGEDRGGWGTIGYNHAYVASQLLLLIGLRLNLQSKIEETSGSVLLLLSLIAVFLTHSRAGFIAALLFAAVYWLKKPLHAFVALAAVAVALLLALALAPEQLASVLDQPTLSSTLERQETLTNPADPDNLSGRTDIWREHIKFLDQRPLRWVIGAGFGATADNDIDNAHMIYLQIVTEIGVVGLLVFLALFASILSQLRRCEHRSKALFWATLVLLFASLTQETFYPVPAQGFFLGFYLCTVAIVLHNPIAHSVPDLVPAPKNKAECFGRPVPPGLPAVEVD